MQPFIKFPSEREKILQEALAFRRMSPEQQTRAFLELLALGEAILKESPHREAILRQQQAEKEDWRKAHKELFARHGF